MSLGIGRTVELREHPEPLQMWLCQQGSGCLSEQMWGVASEVYSGRAGADVESTR